MLPWTSVSNLQKNIEETLNSGDPTVRTWFLVRNKYLPFILCGCYVLSSTVLGPAFMKNRKAFNLRWLMMIYNLFLVFIYGSFLILAIFYVQYANMEMFCYGGKVVKGEVSYDIVSSAWFIYFVKYVEFLDTLFFILRKKFHLVSFLHVSHHAIVPLLGWVLFRTETGGFQFIPVTVNAIVHVIMYSYYGLAAMGPRVRKYLWWKKYITQIQMAQMIVMSLFLTFFAPLTGCKMGLSSYVIYTSVFPFYFYLFYRFYKTSFKSRTKSTEKNRQSEEKTLKNELANEISNEREAIKEASKKQK